MDPVTQYATDVVSGDVLACRYVTQACQRHIADLARNDVFYDEELAQKRIRAFGLFRHYKGECAGSAFKLEPWQQFLVGSVYGWRMKSGQRRFKTVYVEVPRKNGKTTLSAGIGIIELINEDGSEVYSLATKEQQAKLSWRDGSVMIQRSEALASELKIRVKEIRYPVKNGIWQPLGNDSDTLDGLNPQCGIVDEFHAHKDRRLIDVIDDGMGARREPLLFIITTAGYNMTGPCYEYRSHLLSVLDGTFTDDRFFGMVFTVDDPDAWEDETEWAKANPNLGVSKSLEYMRDQRDLARAMPSKRNAFLNKQLNIWTRAEVTWLPMERWNACAGAVEEETLISGRCFGGLDLSSTRDITSFALFWPTSGMLRVWNFVPEETAIEHGHADQVPYREWIDRGHLLSTPGNVVDYAYIKSHILSIPYQNLGGIAFDRWNSSQIVTELMEEGVDMRQFGQGYRDMTSPSKELERLVVSGKLRHDGNPVLDWMAGNVVVEMDPAGNLKPNKAKSQERNKIDGIVAAIMAIGLAMVEDEEPEPGVMFL